jgi:hypothetical protein
MASPTSNDLLRIWVNSSSSAFAVGPAGTIIRFNGTVWSTQTSGTGEDLRSVWGTGDNNMYAVGDAGTILRYNGTTWTGMTSTTPDDLSAIWGTSGANIWAAGDDGTTVRFNGTTWTVVANPSTSVLSYFTIHGTGPNDVYVAGWGELMHFDGTSWSIVTPDIVDVAYEMWVFSGNNILHTGLLVGSLTRWDGSTFVPEDAGIANRTGGVYAASASEIYVVGYGGLIVVFSP